MNNPRKDLPAIGLLAVLVTLFLLPLFQDLKTAVPGLDWYGTYAFPSFFRLSVLQYHQFPLRAPHFGGGYPLIGHPYDISLNPLSVIVLLFGDIAGTKITVFLIFLISALSVFYLTRYIRQYTLLGALFSSLTFAFSSWGACQYLQSHYEKLYIYFLPLALVLLIKAKENKKFIFFTSLTVSMVILCGGSMLIPFTLFLFLFACFNGIDMEKWPPWRFNFQYLKVFLLAVCVALLICMVKILPMNNLVYKSGIESVHFPYENDYSKVSQTMIEQERALNPVKLGRMLFDKKFYIVGTERVAGDDFMQFYLGYIPVLLAAFAFIFFWRKTFVYFLLLLIFTLLSFGPYSKLDLFKWLWRLSPAVHSIWRLDEFFTFPIFFIISIVAGEAFSLFKKNKRGMPLFFLVLGMLFSLNNMFWPNRRFLHNTELADVPKKMVHFIGEQELHGLQFQKQFYQVKIKDPSADPEHYQKDGYFYLQQNVGVADWLYTNLKIKSSVIPKYFVRKGDYKYVSLASKNLETNPLYKGEAFFDNGHNDARIEYFSPNEIRVAVTLKGRATLVINQNYHPSWRTSAGKLSDRDGLLAVTLDRPGDYMIQLTYVPMEFYRGLGISILSLLLACYFMVYKTRSDATRRDRRAV